MKKILIMSILFASQTYTASLSLHSGESTVITANVNTLVTCDGSAAGGADCASKASSLKGLLDKCTKNLSTEWCTSKTWPNWKANNSSCFSEGSQVCVDKCMQNLSTEWCMSNCQ